MPSSSNSSSASKSSRTSSPALHRARIRAHAAASVHVKRNEIVHRVASIKVESDIRIAVPPPSPFDRSITPKQEPFSPRKVKLEPPTPSPPPVSKIERESPSTTAQQLSELRLSDGGSNSSPQQQSVGRAFSRPQVRLFPQEDTDHIDYESRVNNRCRCRTNHSDICHRCGSNLHLDPPYIPSPRAESNRWYWAYLRNMR